MIENAGGGRIELHPGIPALSRGLEHAGYSRASGKGFLSCPSWSRGACPTALVSSCLSLGGWLCAAAPGQWPCQGSAPRREWRGAGGALHPWQNPTRQVCPRADSACSSTALCCLCPPRGARSQVARCSQRLPAPACQVWQRPGSTMLPGWGCAPEPPLHPMAAAASAVGLSLLHHCDFLRQGKLVSIIHLCELCHPCRTGGDKYGTQGRG